MTTLGQSSFDPERLSRGRHTRISQVAVHRNSGEPQFTDHPGRGIAMRGMSKAAVFVVMLLAGTAPLAAQGTPARIADSVICPPTARATITPVFRALSMERMAEFREEHGLTRVNARNLKPLRSHRSAAVCQKLNAYYATSMFARAPWERTYFEADGFYFASFVDLTNPNPGSRRRGHFAIFDASLRLVGIFPRQRPTPSR